MTATLFEKAKRLLLCVGSAIIAFSLLTGKVFASEVDIVVPQLSQSQSSLLLIGIGVCVLGMVFAIIQYNRIKKLNAHKSMLDVSKTIYETCKTYLLQQGKFLIILFILLFSITIIQRVL